MSSFTHTRNNFPASIPFRPRLSHHRLLKMFGDAFGQRSDYSLGVFYANHRKYLNGKNSLEPPRELMTKRQARHRQLMESLNAAEEKKNFAVAFQAKKDDDAALKKLRKTVRIVKNAHAAVTVDEEQVWAEEFQAGVRLWVNKETGEVLSESPFGESSECSPNQSMSSSFDYVSSRSDRFKSYSFKSSSSCHDEPSLDLDDDSGDCECVDKKLLGTGSLVYDSSEVDELFSMLDKASRK